MFYHEQKYINYTLIDMFKVLDLDLDEPVFTISILKAHMMRLVLALITPFVFLAHQWNQFWSNVEFYFNAILWMSNDDVNCCARQPTKNGVLAWLNSVLGYYVNYVWVIPRNIHKIYAAKKDPRGLKNLQYVMPQLNASSVACVFEYPMVDLEKPDDLPKPYLDADKRYVEPSKEELEEAEQLHAVYKEEFDIRQNVETVKFLRHVGKLVTWMCLNSTVTELVIYERTGTLGKSVDDIKEAILIGLSQMICFCDSFEMQDLSRLVPKIVIDINGEQHDVSAQYSMIGLVDVKPSNEFIVKFVDENSDHDTLKPSELIMIMSPETKLFGYSSCAEYGDHDVTISNCVDFSFGSVVKAILLFHMNGGGRGRL
ncbi:hypothetical protein JNB11_06150 [Kocuria palustris]|nr:hypothetical protein [Kocuria palustris]